MHYLLGAKILDKRFAGGEISIEEYQKMKVELKKITPSLLSLIRL